jgi:hypothetical protein
MAGSNYGGTGLSVDKLAELPEHERERILATAMVSLRKQIADLKNLLDEAQSYLLEGMRARNATVAPLDGIKVNVTYDRRYEYVIEGGLDALQNLMPPDEYDQLVREETVWNVNRRLLKQLASRGDAYREIIARSERLTREHPTVDITRR